MNKNNIEKLKRINLYENEINQGYIQDIDPIYLLIEGLGLNVVEVLEELRDLIETIDQHLTLRNDFRKSNIRSEKVDIKEKIEEAKKLQMKQYQTLKNKFLNTGYIDNIKDIKDPYLINKINEKDSLGVAHNQHSNKLNQTIKILMKEPEIVSLFEEELSKVNLTFDMVKALNKAVFNRDKVLYDKVRRIISTNFNKLPKAIEAFDFSGVIVGCIRRGAYIDNTHEYFNTQKAEVFHPEIFICKVILSKVLNKI